MTYRFREQAKLKPTSLALKRHDYSLSDIASTRTQSHLNHSLRVQYYLRELVARVSVVFFYSD